MIKRKVINGKRYHEWYNLITGQRMMVRDDRNLLLEPVDIESFIVAWQTSRSVLEAASKSDMGQCQAQAFALELRKRGVALKRMNVRRHTLDVKALNKMAKKAEAAGNPKRLVHAH